MREKNESKEISDAYLCNITIEDSCIVIRKSYKRALDCKRSFAYTRRRALVDCFVVRVC